MRKKWICLLAAGAVLLTGCAGRSAAQTADAPAEPAEETVSEPAPEEPSEQEVGMVNPWKDTTEDEADLYNPRQFIVPDGATNTHWSMMGTEDYDAVPGPLVQLNFDLDGISYCARSQYGVGENEDHDISGMYYEWQDKQDVTLDAWGGGEMTGTAYDFTLDNDSAKMCLWYDIEIGIAYSLSAAAEDLSGCDIVAVANALAPEEEFMPGSFVEYKTQKDVFASYDEIISELDPGQGYAYLELTGSEDKVLAITDQIFDYGDGVNASNDVYLYGEEERGFVNIGNCFSSGEDYPVRVGNGLLYALTDSVYESDFLSEENGGLMVKDYISQYTEDDGSIAYTGFLRSANDFDHDEELPEDAASLYEQLRNEAEKQQVISFTVVE